MGFFSKLVGSNDKGGGKMANLLHTLVADLNLDENQVAKITESFKAFKQQRREIKSGDGDRSKIQTARAQMTNQLMDSLNDQQKQIFMANSAKYDGLLHQHDKDED